MNNHQVNRSEQDQTSSQVNNSTGNDTRPSASSGSSQSSSTKQDIDDRKKRPSGSIVQQPGALPETSHSRGFGAPKIKAKQTSSRETKTGTVSRQVLPECVSSRSCDTKAGHVAQVSNNKPGAVPGNTMNAIATRNRRKEQRAYSRTSSTRIRQQTNHKIDTVQAVMVEDNNGDSDGHRMMRQTRRNEYDHEELRMPQREMGPPHAVLIAADTPDRTTNGTEQKKQRHRIIAAAGVMCMLVLVLVVVAGLILLPGRNKDDGQALIPVTSEAPTGFVDVLTPPPTADPSLPPTSSPTISLQFDPPSEQDCNDIANNRTLAGQEDLLRRDFTIKFDVTISNSGDISRGQVQELLDALERLFVPRMVGCSEVDIGRRRLGSVKQEQNQHQQQQQRRLQRNRYVIGNADVTINENINFKGQDEDAECDADFTSDPQRCHVVDVEMAVYLKGSVSDLFVITVISNVGKGNLVPPLELSDALSEVYLSKAEKGVTVQTGTPSVFPSEWPSSLPLGLP